MKWFDCVPWLNMGIQDSDIFKCCVLLFGHEDIRYWHAVVEALSQGRHRETATSFGAPMTNFSKSPPMSMLGKQWAYWEYLQSRVRSYLKQSNHWNFSPQHRWLHRWSCPSVNLPHIHILVPSKTTELIQWIGRCSRRGRELSWGFWTLHRYWILPWGSTISQEAWCHNFSQAVIAALMKIMKWLLWWTDSTTH